MAYSRPCRSLAGRTIATVGSGVMAEAIIAGLLRGNLVAPDQIVASHPRAERREALDATHGIRTVDRMPPPSTAPTSSCSGSSPRCSRASDASFGPALQPGQLVISILAGRDDPRAHRPSSATARSSGHAEHARPARPRNDRLVRDARTVRGAARAGGGAPRRRSGTQIEVDDEKFVAMATAVSGTGPTYVFLVMEALIDAAVHLGFPRHVAHDLVIETLEGSTHFAKQSGDAPGPAPEHGHVAGRDERRGAPRARSGRLRTVLSEAVWAAFRRTVELGEQLEASAERD